MTELQIVNQLHETEAKLRYWADLLDQPNRNVGLIPAYMRLEADRIKFLLEARP